jgi:hypothetical protein
MYRERERADRADARAEELQAGQAPMTDMHARELTVAQHAAQAAQEAAEALRRADTRRGRR